MSISNVNNTLYKCRIFAIKLGNIGRFRLDFARGVTFNHWSAIVILKKLLTWTLRQSKLYIFIILLMIGARPLMSFPDYIPQSIGVMRTCTQHLQPDDKTVGTGADIPVLQNHYFQNNLFSFWQVLVLNRIKLGI
jgi:hypothetical protein